MISSKLESMEIVATTDKHNWNSIMRWYESLVTNGILECTSIFSMLKNVKIEDIIQ